MVLVNTVFNWRLFILQVEFSINAKGLCRIILPHLINPKDHQIFLQLNCTKVVTFVQVIMLLKLNDRVNDFNIVFLLRHSVPSHIVDYIFIINKISREFEYGSSFTNYESELPCVIYRLHLQEPSLLSAVCKAQFRLKHCITVAA